MLECRASLSSAHALPNYNEGRSPRASGQTDGECDAVHSPGTPSVTADDDTPEPGFLEQPLPPGLIQTSSSSLTLAWQSSSVAGVTSGDVADLNSRLQYRLEYQKVRIACEHAPLFHCNPNCIPWSVSRGPVAVKLWRLRSGATPDGRGHPAGGIRANACTPRPFNYAYTRACRDRSGPGSCLHLGRSCMHVLITPSDTQR